MAGPAGLASFESPSAAFDWLRCQTGATRSVATATRQRAIQLGRATGHGTTSMRKLSWCLSTPASSAEPANIGVCII